METHRYILEPYKGMNSRYHCPSCNQREKTFTRYIDIETGKYIALHVGRCSRENNCGYHYTPKQYYQDNHISKDTTKIIPTHKLNPITNKPISFVPVEVFNASRTNHEPNNFIKFLCDLFGIEVTMELISQYFIATSNHWPGATIFWQIDTLGRIRTGKIMLYYAGTGKRVKEPFNHIAWIHSSFKQSGFELKQCLFGEQLLQDKLKPVAIVESEKTAIIASVYFPQLIWLATGSLNNLNHNMFSVLKGRNVILFPDINGYEKWSTKARELSCLASIKVSRLLEDHASESDRKQGLDLADYLIRYNYKEFTHPNPLKKTSHSPVWKNRSY